MDWSSSTDAVVISHLMAAISSLAYMRRCTPPLEEASGFTKRLRVHQKVCPKAGPTEGVWGPSTCDGCYRAALNSPSLFPVPLQPITESWFCLLRAAR